jgi:hypothetical protein
MENDRIAELVTGLSYLSSLLDIQKRLRSQLYGLRTNSLAHAIDEFEAALESEVLIELEKATGLLNNQSEQ